MSRNVALACAASIVLNIGFVIMGRGSCLQLAAAGVMVFLAIACVGIGSFCSVFGQSPEIKNRVSAGYFTTGAVAASCLLSLPIGSMLHQREVVRATDFCEKLRPELERYRQVNGQYPDRLSQIQVRGELPSLLKGEEFYRVRDGVYEFDFTDPSSLFAGYHFDSRQGEWYRWD